MSLRVWLPLNGSLENKGLDDITPSLTGAVTVDNEGKIGECYKFGTSLGRITIPPTIMHNYTECSITFWVNILGWQTNWDTFFQAGLGTAPWNSYIFGVLRNSGNSVVFTISDASSSSQGNYKSSDLILNTWYHLGFTYKSGHCCIYVNGNLYKDYSTNIIPNFSGINYISLGQLGNASNYQTNCKMNDVRIYDHALSPLEIKHISQGLILHYPLNRGGWGQENLFNWSNNATGITLNDYQNKGSFTQFTNSLTFDPSTTVGKKYTISFWAKSPNGTTSLILYNTNSYPKYFYFSTTLTSSLGTEWQFFKYTVTNTQYSGSGTASTNTNIWKRIEIYAPHQMKVQVKQIKVEEGSIATPWCPNSSDELATTMGLNDNVEYDTSGYGNNGTKNNSPTYSSDTVKYNVSTHLDGVNQTIQLPNLTTLTPDSIFTFNIWFKRLSAEPSSKPWETILGGLSGFELETCSANNVHDNKVKAYSWGGGTFEFELDKWNMLTMVSNGANALFYLNGNLKLTGTYKALVSGNYFIGSWRDTASQNYKGYISDVRIYATALSAEDVKDLYELGATIDTNGTLSTYEFAEQ